jgi:regulator of sirC expression with transglutaminase-like and TPR domain
MANNAPLCCSPAAFKLLARQMKNIESPDALLNGAVAIAMHQMDHVDLKAIDRQIQGYADRLRQRVRGRQPQALLAHLHDVLFEDEGFHGSSEDYYNPLNSYLPAMLKTKQGIPITLCLLYKLVAERVGFKSWGVGLPGHFLAGIECGGDTLLIDCFAGGRILSNEEAHEQMVLHLGPDVEWSMELLQPISNRRFLTRFLQNLLNLFGTEDRFQDVAAILEMEMLLWPDQQHLQRDLALVLARCGFSQPAGIWLDKYLKSNPDDPQLPELQQLREVLK